MEYYWYIQVSGENRYRESVWWWLPIAFLGVRLPGTLPKPQALDENSLVQLQTN